MKKISTGIIGLGRITHGYEDDPHVVSRMKYPTHLSAIKAIDDFELVAASDESATAREVFKGKVDHQVAIYSSAKKLISSQKLDLLVVATNTNSHIQICDLAIDAGIKFILCEKPISYSYQSAKRIVDKAKKHNVGFAVNYFRGFTDSYIRLIESIKEGKFGRVQSINCKYTKGLYNNGSHFINLLLKISPDVKSAQGFFDRAASKETDKTMDCVISFRDGFNAFIQGLDYKFFNLFEMDILLENGRINIQNDKLNLYRVERSSNFLTRSRQSGFFVDISGGLLPVYKNIDNYFLGKKNNIVWGEEALAALKIIALIERNSKWGKN
ncbi:hypothetical protein A3D81_01155 [Candidatus Curtissbacteria bacterium RIFCSPHIGHO2_02_FULL_40_17]|uniref:Gfo/Idh/MocA-like oxidoreductase N-terminal domain-containing protein n=4 Tax=Candidatus Curtissiibacteriota TaxID=1752717 RepID=A0A1F5GHQ6_9BACT|nr:MAG: hypothetical protein A2693_02715 [Candidatus Curtissbacteria bacterium RIFCSPHIGHO2_01_FULL_40_12]OGD91390.1 MAG: hypothetical protein A3D81_01155 [Candidatus Curtissbacteria bacterium RIFCSPHIGHO2_02_FULL_40_17]OGE04046.1 MAG: hypothetical protein A3F45_02840 [Candidatus Curtissbacteria bacterium RIFCSPHIGHO2_12_FULL_41_17]OGE08600.1 MAG: hypothetical protein A3I53_02410 [Candidatus Curtissbacteria bacterium RIFCSPLOWO2_02_FULL_40_13b]